MGDVWVVIYVKYTVISPHPYIIPWHELVQLLALLIVSKATLRPTRAPNKTPALAQEWAVWTTPTLDLMHVTLTERKQRVYSRLVFKTYKRALCNWLRKLSKRNVEFHCKAQCADT